VVSFLLSLTPKSRFGTENEKVSREPKYINYLIMTVKGRNILQRKKLQYMATCHITYEHENRLHLWNDMLSQWQSVLKYSYNV
jgi:predicted nucleotidyltransferase